MFNETTPKGMHTKSSRTKRILNTFVFVFKFRFDLLFPYQIVNIGKKFKFEIKLNLFFIINYIRFVTNTIIMNQKSGLSLNLRKKSIY